MTWLTAEMGRSTKRGMKDNIHSWRSKARPGINKEILEKHNHMPSRGSEIGYG